MASVGCTKVRAVAANPAPLFRPIRSELQAELCGNHAERHAAGPGGVWAGSQLSREEGDYGGDY